MKEFFYSCAEKKDHFWGSIDSSQSYKISEIEPISVRKFRNLAESRRIL